MKRVLTLILCVFCWVQWACSYSWKEAKDDFIRDSEEVFLKDLRSGLYIDFLEREITDRYKFGSSTMLLAYKFVGLAPIVLYTPKSADAIVEFGLSFPIRLSRIPIGNGNELRDLALERNPSGNLLDRIYLGFYASQNLTTGKFGTGLSIGFVF